MSKEEGGKVEMDVEDVMKVEVYKERREHLKINRRKSSWRRK